MSAADQAKGPSARAVEVARAIEADHQFGRQGPQRVHDRALLIDEAAQPLAAALRELLPIIEEHAEDERTFWGDKHGYAVIAENILQQARDALRGWDQGGGQ